MSEIKFSTRNITKFFRTIDPATVAEGRQWYPRARNFAYELRRSEPDEYDQEFVKAAAVIAVLSPQLNWDRNKELALLAYGSWTAIQTYDPGMVQERVDSWPGLRENARKAFRILDGEEPNDVVGGPKVRQFWFTIMDPTDPRAVVVDRHAFSVAAGRALTDAELGKSTGGQGRYDAVSEMYRSAAKILGAELGSPITPAEVQAITWTHWRRTHAKNAKATRRNELKEI